MKMAKVLAMQIGLFLGNVDDIAGQKSYISAYVLV